MEYRPARFWNILLPAYTGESEIIGAVRYHILEAVSEKKNNSGVGGGFKKWRAEKHGLPGGGLVTLKIPRVIKSGMSIYSMSAVLVVSRYSLLSWKMNGMSQVSMPHSFYLLYYITQVF